MMPQLYVYDAKLFKNLDLQGRKFILLYIVKVFYGMFAFTLTLSTKISNHDHC